MIWKEIPNISELSSHEILKLNYIIKANPVETVEKMMGRMHDKYLIADGKTYILGGRNTYIFPG